MTTNPTQPVAREEIRFAVVLNGGVSLAVWMGGTVLELDRLTRGRGPYGALLGLVAGSARADVVAGTSAGGINGAALALSQVNAAADLTRLRDLWADQGRMETLLREPFQGSPASLLRGDEYFLPRLGEAMAELARPFAPYLADARPIDLTITTTLLRGARTVTVDAMGARLPQTVHEGRFQFRRDPGGVVGSDLLRRDDFTHRTIAATAARLGLAARTTAGFPIAFEPSFVPAQATKPGSNPLAGDEDPLRPDMGGVASWRTTGPSAELPPDRSRFAVDGGLLANTPTRAALAAVDRMPAAAPVRRVALLVYPHAPVDAPDRADRDTAMPEVGATAAALLGALSSQGSRTFVDEVEDHNRAAGSRRGSRYDLLATTGGDPAALHELARVLLDHYRALRTRRVARDLTDRSRARPGWSYERMRAAAESTQQAWRTRRRETGLAPSLPYVADTAPDDGSPGGATDGWGWGFTTADGLTGAALDLLKRLVWVVPAESVATVEGARATVHAARTTLRRLRSATDDLWTDEPALAALAPNGSYWTMRLAAYHFLMLPGPDGRAELSAARQRLLAAVRRDAVADKYPREEVDRRVDEVDAALGRLAKRQPASVGTGMRAAVDETVEAVRSVLPALAALDTTRPWLADLRVWQRLLPAATTSTELLGRLLSLEVATWSLADEVSTGAEYPVDLVQLSLQTTNAFALRTRTADDKVGGLAVNRFGGFLKQSWRVNDWTWGRLDAASTLCRVVLDPERLRRVVELDGRLAATTPELLARTVVTGLVTELYGPAGPPHARIADLVEPAVAELRAIYDSPAGAGDLPTAVPALADLAAWALHLRIAATELPALARAVRADRVDGANARSRGELFLLQEEQLLAELETLPAAPTAPLPPAAASPYPDVDDGIDPDHVPADPPDPQLSRRLQLGVRALEAFDRAGIGREPLSEEGSSDQMIRTVTSALGVAVTVADGQRSGLRAVKPVTRTLRGAALLPYWTVTGLTRGGSLARFLALLALALGGTLLALALLGAVPRGLSGPAAAAGVASLLAAFGYGALRTGTLLHGVVLLTPLVPLLVFAATGAEDAATPSAGSSAAEVAARVGATTVVVVLVLVLGLIALGSLPAPLGSPPAALGRALDRAADRAGLPPHPGRRVEALRRVLARIAVGTLLSAAVAAGGWWLWLRTPDLAAAVRDRPWWAAVLTVLVVAAAGRVAWTGGRALRTWQLRPRTGEWVDPAVTAPAGATVGWSVLYGVGYLTIGAAVAVLAPPDDRWARAALATCVIAAVLLLLVVPVALPRMTRAHVKATLVAEAAPATYPRSWALEGQSDAALSADLVDRLLARNLTHRYLVEPGPGGTLRLRPGARGTRKAVQQRLGELRTATRRGAGQWPRLPGQRRAQPRTTPTREQADRQDPSPTTAGATSGTRRW